MTSHHWPLTTDIDTAPNTRTAGTFGRNIASLDPLRIRRTATDPSALIGPTARSYRPAPRYHSGPRRNAALFDTRPIETTEVSKDEDEDDPVVHAAFRKQDRHNATIRLPAGFDPFDKASDKAQFDKIAKDTGCRLVPHPVDDSVGVLIWGTQTQCDTAKDQLRSWSIARGKAIKTKAARFGYVHKFNQVKDDWLCEKAKQDELRKKFRTDCDITAFKKKKYSHAIILEYKHCDWMNDGILGRFMEALDPIRMDNLCHITYMPNIQIAGIRHGFFLCGTRKELMDRAVDRLKNLDQQIISRSIEVPQFFLFKPVATSLNYSTHAIKRKVYSPPQLFGQKVVRERDDENIQVMLLATASCRKSKSDLLLAEEKEERSISNLASGAILLGNRHINFLNIQYIDVWLTTMLERVRCWQGYLEMRIQIGTCAFTNFPTVKEYSLRDFEEVIQTRNTDADATGIEAYITTE